MEDLSSLLTGENAAFVGGILALVSTLRGAFKKFFRSTKGQRLLPVLPVVLGIVAAMVGIGEAKEALPQWQDKLVLGILAGFTAGQLFKAGKTSVFGWGIADQPQEAPAGSSPSPASGRESGSEAKEKD